MKRLKLIAFFLVTVLWFLVTLVSHSYADIPHTINYQGKLTDKQGYALTGSYNVTFRLYDAPTGGNLLWQEAHSGVSVQKGLFSVLLGTITSLNLPFDKQYYLSIQVGADPEMTPRQALASAPYAFSAESGVPKGTIMAWSTNTPPSGWLLCDGSAISRTEYSTLFNLIGTTYGAGDGSTTFNLPNLKGKIMVGRDPTQTEFDTLAENGGEKMHTLTIDEMPSHGHSYTWRNGVNGNINTGGLAYAASGGNTSNTGGGQAHNNLQPYLVLNYIIKS